MNDFLTRTLVAYAEVNEDLWWRRNEAGQMTMFANISDTFFWGFADLEEFNDQHLDLLERCAAQLRAAQGSTRSLSDYFASRLRGMRPQGAAYPVRYDQRIWGLLNDCGLAREAGQGNPRNVPDFDEDVPATLIALSATADPIQVSVDVELRDALLDLFAFDYTDDLRWQAIEGELKFFVCDAHFGEQLHPVDKSDLGALIQSKSDMKEAGQDYFFVDLFLARHRQVQLDEKNSFDPPALALVTDALAARA